MLSSRVQDAIHDERAAQQDVKGAVQFGVQRLPSYLTFSSGDRLAGLVVKASASGAEDPGFASRSSRDFPESSHTRDLKIGTPLATLPGAWRYRVSAGTGWPGVSIL